MKRIIACIIVTAMLVACFASCSGGDLSIDIDCTISEETLEYTLFANDLSAYNEPNRVVEKWEKQFNVKLNLDGSGADWMETLSLRINSDDMPELFFYVPNDPNYMAAYSNFVKKLLVLPLSDLATKEDAPNLHALLSVDDYSDLTVNGKMYFMPAPNIDFNNTIYVRRDWMDQLGIQTPKTIDEFTAMLKAFTDLDPDGNGKKDTYGMAASKVFEWLSYFRLSFGVKPGWSKTGGEWHLDAFTPAYRDFLTWMRDLYEKGYLKNEFYLYDDSDAMNDFYNGKAGVAVFNGGRATGGVTYLMRRLNKDAVVDVIPMPDGVAKGGYTANGKWWGGWSIAYDAKEPMRLVKMLDYFCSEEGIEERLYGLKGIHYDKDAAGEIVPNFEERLKEKMFGATDDGKPRDVFAVGAYFGSAYKIFNNKLADNISKNIYSESELAQRSSEYGNGSMVRAFPMDTFSLGEEYAKTYSKVADRIYTYSVRIVAGNIGLEEGLERMHSTADSDGYATLQKIIKEAYD